MECGTIVLSNILNVNLEPVPLVCPDESGVDKTGLKIGLDVSCHEGLEGWVGNDEGWHGLAWCLRLPLR